MKSNTKTPRKHLSQIIFKSIGNFRNFSELRSLIPEKPNFRLLQFIIMGDTESDRLVLPHDYRTQEGEYPQLL